MVAFYFYYMHMHTSPVRGPQFSPHWWDLRPYAGVLEWCLSSPAYISTLDTIYNTNRAYSSLLLRHWAHAWVQKPTQTETLSHQQGGRSSRLFGVGTDHIMVHGRGGGAILPYCVPNWQAITPGEDILLTKWVQAPSMGS